MAYSELGIEAIYVERGDALREPIHTGRFLNSLSDTEWTELRAAATTTGKTETPLLRCGDCQKPVYARDSITGRRHCYHFKTESLNCRWASAVAKNLRSIDAQKFQGRQESELHKSLKRMISDILQLDESTAAAGVFFERYTKGKNGNYAFPDVYAASWQGGPAAFEIQLSTTHLPTILRRERFYADNDIRLCWIVGNVEKQFERRAFKDIYLRNDGQILGIDADVIAQACNENAPRLRLYRLLPVSVDRKFIPTWKNKIVSPDEIDWGSPNSKPKSQRGSYDNYLNIIVESDSELVSFREKFYSALSESNERNAEIIWNTVAEKIGGTVWKKLPQSYDTFKALGVLATIRRGKISVETRLNYSNLPQLINSMLLEPQARRCWTHAFQLLTNAIMPEVLEFPSIQRKCSRNRNASQTETPPDLLAGPVFDVFFPEGAFKRLRLSKGQ